LGNHLSICKLYLLFLLFIRQVCFAARNEAAARKCICTSLENGLMRASSEARWILCTKCNFMQVLNLLIFRQPGTAIDASAAAILSLLSCLCLWSLRSKPLKTISRSDSMLSQLSFVVPVVSCCRLYFNNSDNGRQQDQLWRVVTESINF